LEEEEDVFLYPVRQTLILVGVKNLNCSKLRLLRFTMVECEVVVGKILEVGEGCSIVKTFFVMERVQNNGTILAIVVIFLFSSKFS
jgi:hypothetical protein